MFADEARVLIILPQDLVDRARGVAGRATTSMKLPVSLQIVLRALLEEGLKRPGDEALLANIRGQAEAVRRIRSESRRPAAAHNARSAAAARSRPGVGSRRLS
jgi:hypothetical protein